MTEKSSPTPEYATVPSEEKKKEEAPEKSSVPPEKPSDTEIFDLTKAVDNELVKKYQPKFLAKGGEHIIYEIPGHPDIVVKVEASIMAKIQKYNAEHGFPLDAMDPELLPYAQEVVCANQERYGRIKKHFGSDHVLGMKQALVKIPVTRSIIEQLHNGTIPGGNAAKESWAVVRVQKRAPEFADAERQSVVAGYAETRNPDPEKYARVTGALVEGDPHAAFATEEFRGLVPKQFRNLLEKAEKDEVLAAVLRDFVEKTVAYVEETGEILDLAGTDNVTVFQKDGKWNYRLVDALYPAGTNPKSNRMIEMAHEAVAKAGVGGVIDEGQKNLVFNVLNFLRAINGMARELGVDRQISLVAEADRGKVDYLKLLETQYKKWE